MKKNITPEKTDRSVDIQIDTHFLTDIGITEGETKVYLALLRLGSAKTGLLAKEAQVSSSKVYKILARLMVKGLVGHVTKGKIQHFNALGPARILQYMDEKEEQLRQKRVSIEKIIPQLELAQRMAHEKTEATIYDGFKAVTNLFRSIVDELQRGEEYYVLGANYGDVPGLRPFFHQHHIRRAEKGIKLVMLANHDTKDNLEQTTTVLSEIRFLPQYLLSHMEIVFYKRKTFMVVWTKNPVGFLIENEEATQGFRKYFETFWAMAEK